MLYVLTELPNVHLKKLKEFEYMILRIPPLSIGITAVT